MAPIELGEEVGQKRVFVWAIDWPGWCRSGKTQEAAIASLGAAGSRYAGVARAGGLSFVATGSFSVVESVLGSGGTDFGVPSVITESDRRPADSADAVWLATLVEAAWRTFDRIAAAAPGELRKGPRGGGRNRDKVIDHVLEADHAYAREIGIKIKAGAREDREAVDAERAAILEVLREPSNGTPLASRKWTQRYAARRIAWHALDHSWEIEDRAER